MKLPRRQFLHLAAGAAAASVVSRIAKAQTTSLEVVVWGSGPRVLLVHGGISNGPVTWSEQRPLGERWRLEVVNRRGYGKSPAPVSRSDFEEDAQDIAALLGDGAHLVAHSYGAIGALYAAALRPQAVRSLVVNEPPAFGLAKGNAAAAAMMAAQAAIQKDVEPRVFLESFLRVIYSGSGPPPRPPDPLPPALEQGVRTTMAQRPPWEANIPLDALKRTSFPKLVISGGHHGAYEAVCDVLHRELKTERATIRGAGHNVQRTGAPFNDKIEAFLKSV
jgi:pimeloyl-ACP methyl ester carboxylesterase